MHTAPLWLFNKPVSFLALRNWGSGKCCDCWRHDCKSTYTDYYASNIQPQRHLVIFLSFYGEMAYQSSRAGRFRTITNSIDVKFWYVALFLETYFRSWQ